MAKILIVDDDTDITDLIRIVLEKDGHRITTAHDGQTCLDRIDLEKPDLLVLDVMMPIMDGYTVFSRLASNDDTRNIPILILTAKGQMKDVFESSGSVADYMEKPFEANELRARVKVILAARSR